MPAPHGNMPGGLTPPTIVPVRGVDGTRREVGQGSRERATDGRGSTAADRPAAREAGLKGADIHFLHLIGWSRFREGDFIVLLEEHVHRFGKSIDVSFGVDSLFHSRQYNFWNEALMNLTKKHGL